MDVVATPISAQPTVRPAWRLNWLTPGVCRVLLLLLLAFGFFSHLHYLHNDCPIDLAGDEAQYWEWSRNLDLSYYSKGPLVAYIIAASTAIFGDHMPAVRYPALVLGVLTSIVTYLLTLRLFRSDRLALGVVALYHFVPLFVAGSMLMTIDPPFYLCWALATYLLACVMFPRNGGAGVSPATAAGTAAPQGLAFQHRENVLWVVIGVVAGVGFLAKYAMFLWFIPMLLALAVDPIGRRWLRSRWPWVAIGVACLFTTQVIIWNARNGWVSAQHVGTQTGAAGGKFAFANLLELFGGQAGILGPGVAIFMIAGVLYALTRGRAARQNAPQNAPRGFTVVAEGETPSRRDVLSDDAATVVVADPHYRQLRFLVVMGVTFFCFTVVTAFRAKVQMNWPAPAYFTLMILAAYFLSTRLVSKQAWKPWRPWFWFTIVFGLVMQPIAHYPELLYPAVRWANDNVVPLKQPWTEQGGWRKSVAKLIPSEPMDAQKIDFTYKLKGWKEAGQALSKELRDLGPDTFMLCHDYQQAAALAFYLEGQPITFAASSYYQVEPGRMTQYDVWPNRDLSPNSPLVGKNAIFLGRHETPFGDLLNAFERVEGVASTRMKQVDGQWVEVPIQRAFKVRIEKEGLEVRTFRYFKCYGFKGMNRPSADKVAH